MRSSGSSKRFDATLEHWHYDVWKIKWDHGDQLPWFQFGTVAFKVDNNLRVTGLEFDVPNSGTSVHWAMKRRFGAEPNVST